MFDEVPDKTIVAIPATTFDMSKLPDIIAPFNGVIRRNWFTTDFYRCLPLIIGNQQGFSVSVPYGFEAVWNGGDLPSDTIVTFFDDYEDIVDRSNVTVTSHFGYGIITIELPFILKTPKNINLMTMNPPNYVNPNMTTMCGVVETDNLKHTFTINIILNIENLKVVVAPGHPIACLIPFERGAFQEYSIINANEVMSDDFIKNNISATKDHNSVRQNLINIGEIFDRTYYSGTDIYGNKFNNHQKPNSIGDKNELL